MQFTIEDLCESIEVDDPNMLEQYIYTGMTESIQPVVMFTEPIDDISYDLFNSPQNKYMNFTVKF